MKKFLVSLVVGACACVQAVFSVEWKDLTPQQVYSSEEAVKIVRSAPDAKFYNLPMEANLVAIYFLEDDDVEYNVPKFRENSKRLLIISGLPLNNQFLIYNAVCVDTTQENFEETIMYNQFGFGIQGINKYGRTILNYSGARIEGMAQYDLGDCFILAGVYESSGYCMFKDACLYFIDAATKKVMCFNPEGERLIDFNIALEKPLFYVKPEDVKLKIKDIYVGEFDEKTKSLKKGKIWICENAELKKSSLKK